MASKTIADKLAQQQTQAMRERNLAKQKRAKAKLKQHLKPVKTTKD